MKIGADTVIELDGHRFLFEAGDDIIINEESIQSLKDAITKTTKELILANSKINDLKAKLYQSESEDERNELKKSIIDARKNKRSLKRQIGKLSGELLSLRGFDPKRIRETSTDLRNQIDQWASEKAKEEREKEIGDAQEEQDDIQSELNNAEEDFERYKDENDIIYQDGNWLKASDQDDEGFVHLGQDELDRIEEYQEEIESLQGQLNDAEREEIAHSYELGDVDEEGEFIHSKITPEQMTGTPEYEEEGIVSPQYAEEAERIYNKLQDEEFIPNEMGTFPEFFASMSA